MWNRNKQLIDFLSKHDALEKFTHNARETYKDIDLTLKQISFGLLPPFLAAFSFDETPEGFDYWNDMHKQWEKERI